MKILWQITMSYFFDSWTKPTTTCLQETLKKLSDKLNIKNFKQFDYIYAAGLRAFSVGYQFWLGKMSPKVTSTPAYKSLQS